MFYLLESLGLFVLLAGVLGLGAGWIGARAKAPPRGGTAAAALVAAVVVGAMLLSAGGAVPGRAGLWLDGALLLVLAYMAGCGAGLVYGRVFGRR